MQRKYKYNVNGFLIVFNGYAFFCSKVNHLIFKAIRDDESSSHHHGLSDGDIIIHLGTSYPGFNRLAIHLLLFCNFHLSPELVDRACSLSIVLLHVVPGMCTW